MIGLRTAEDVVNYAFRRIGVPLRVDNLLDGSHASEAAIRVYGQIRDALLSEGEWDFIDRTVNGILLKSAPPSYIGNPWNASFPALPWLYEYDYPIDAVGIRTVKFQPVFLPNFDPRYNRFDVNNDDAFVPSKKVILCNVPNAIIVYAGQVTDPQAWTPSFIDVFADRLGKGLAPLLKDLNAAKFAAAEEQADTVIAAETRG